MKPTLLILAAGLGSRYGGFKQIDPIGPNGEFIIDYSIYDAVRAGFGKIVILTQPELEEPIREHFACTLGTGLELEFAFQKLSDLPEGFTLPPTRQKPWGTGHAIWAARSHLHEPFGVINADDYYGQASFKLLCDFLQNRQNNDFCMVGFELARTLSEFGTVSRGICQEDAEGYLQDVVEHTKIKPDPVHGATTLDSNGEWQPLSAGSIASMNLWGLDSSILPQLEIQFREFLTANAENPKSEFFIPTAIDLLIKKGIARCKIVKTPEQWFGVTYKEDRELAVTAIRELIKRKVYPDSIKLS